MTTVAWHYTVGLRATVARIRFFWYGSLEPVAVERCMIQCRLSEGDEWGGPPETAATILAE